MLQDREVRPDVQVGKTCHRTGEDEGQRSTSIRPSASCIVEKDLGNWAQLQLNAFTPACRSRKLLLTCLKSQWVQMTIDLKFPPEIWKRSLGLTGYSIVVFFKIWCEMMTAWIKKKKWSFSKTLMESVLGGRAGIQRQLKSLPEHSTGVGTLTISHYKSEAKLRASGVGVSSRNVFFILVYSHKYRSSWNKFGKSWKEYRSDHETKADHQSGHHQILPGSSPLQVEGEGCVMCSWSFWNLAFAPADFTPREIKCLPKCNLVFTYTSTQILFSMF